jgi:hypothetical protein
MTFLNWAMLAGLAAVAIPIIIHLLNRHRATLVDWGAMRFLLASLTMRRRRIMLEEIILLALRCLVVALLVLAMARPFLPTRTTIPWATVLPALLVAAILIGVAAAVWSSRRARYALLGVAGLLILFALGTSALEAAFQEKQWSLAGGERDVAILIDGSASMTVPVDGERNFDRAVDEARAILAACRPADAVSIILAGPVPRPVIPNPITDRDELLQALHDLQPSGGSMQVVDAIDAAATSLAEGHNPAKKIVLLTDGQSVGWDGRNDSRWEFLATGLNALPSEPQVVCRTFPLPRTLRNAAVGGIRFSRKIVGTDRPVGIEATVFNTGTTDIEPVSVELVIDGVAMGRQDTGELNAQAAETVRFEHRFLDPGPHEVLARVLADDGLPLDNSSIRVVPVIDRLPVLIVEGEPSPRPLDGAASFIEIALAPVDEELEAALPEPETDEAEDDQAAAAVLDEPALGNLVEPRRVAAVDIEAVKTFEPFGLVVLAGVPRLPAETAERLARYVTAGGGLLIIPGANTVPAFYAEWTTAAGRALAPARLGEKRSMAQAPAHFGLKTLTHPALALLADAPNSDADRALVETYWTLNVAEKDASVRVGGRFDTGDPLLAERRVGEGYVLMTAMPLDRRASNLPSLKCYVPLVHELAYYLAAPTMAELNVRPGSEFTLELPATTAKGEKEAETFADLSAYVVGPRQQRLLADLEATPKGLRVGFAQTYEPGLYRLTLPDALNEAFAVPPAPEAGLPFVVRDSADEGRLVPLTDADLTAATQHVNLFRTDSTDRVLEAVTGDVPGEELWKYLALAAVVCLLAEVGLTRWIATQRRMHAIDTVSFGPEVPDTQTFRARAEEMLAGTTEDSAR